MARRYGLISAAVAAVALPLLLYGLWPWWSALLVRALLQDENVAIERLEIRRPGWNTLALDRLQLVYSDRDYSVRADIGSVELQYRWRALLRGRLDVLRAASAQMSVQWHPDLSAPAAKPLAVAELLPSVLLARVPGSVVDIAQLQVLIDAPLPEAYRSYSGQLRYDVDTLSLQLRNAGAPQLQLLASADRHDQIDIGLRYAGEQLGRITTVADGEQWRGIAQIDFAVADALLHALQWLDKEVVLAGSVQTSWRGQLPATLDTRAARSLALEGEIGGQFAATRGAQQVQVQLAARYRGSQQGIAFDFDDFSATGRGDLPKAWAAYLPLTDALPFSMQTADGSTLHLTFEPLQAKLTGALNIRAGNRNAPLLMTAALSDPQLARESQWRVQTNFKVAAVLPRARYQPYRIQNLRFEASGHMHGSAIASGLQLAKGASARIAQLQWPQGSVKPLNVRTIAPLSLALRDGTLILPDAQLAMQRTAVSFAGRGCHFAAATVRLREMALALQQPDKASAAITARIDGFTTALGEFQLQPISAQTDLRLAAGAVRGHWSLRGPADLYRLNGKLSHVLASGAGELSAALLPLQFTESGKYLPSALKNWNYPLDFSGGTLSADMRLQWSAAPLRASAVVALKDLAGFYNLNLFRGLSTELRVTYRDNVLHLGPAALDLAEVDVGFPVRNFHVEVASDKQGSLHMNNLRAELLGGRLSQPGFVYRPAQAEHDITLHFEGLQIGQLLALEQGVEGSGTLDGVLPVRFSKAGVAVRAGELRARVHGGVIRYRGELPQNAMAAVPAMQLALDSLKNFHYTRLDLRADYSESGDLYLQTQLHGRNPDLAETRPIHFNLNIRENIPDLLRSIQLSRDIGDKIEQRVEDFYQRQQQEALP